MAMGTMGSRLQTWAAVSALLIVGCHSGRPGGVPQSEAETLREARIRCSGDHATSNCGAFVGELHGRLDGVSQSGRDELSAVIAAAGPGIVPYLATYYRDDSYRSRVRHDFAMATVLRIGTSAVDRICQLDSEVAIPMLVPLLRYQEFREAAKSCLLAADRSEAFNTWMVHALARTVPQEPALLASHAMRGLPTELSGRLGAEFASLHHEDWQRAWGVALALGILGDAKSEAVLVEALEQRRSWKLSAAAAVALGALREREEATRLALARASSASWSAVVRAASEEALGGKLSVDLDQCSEVDLRRCGVLDAVREQLDGRANETSCSLCDDGSGVALLTTRWLGREWRLSSPPGAPVDFETCLPYLGAEDSSVINPLWRERQYEGCPVGGCLGYLVDGNRRGPREKWYVLHGVDPEMPGGELIEVESSHSRVEVRGLAQLPVEPCYFAALPDGGLLVGDACRTVVVSNTGEVDRVLCAQTAPRGRKKKGDRQ